MYKSKTDRSSLENVITMLRPHDILVTTKLSNLGRNYTEALEYWKRIMERLAFVVTLEPPINDRRFSLRLTMEDYNELDRIRERLGGISRSETLRRGVNFLHGVIATGEFPKWQEFAAKVPRYERTGKRKENGLASGKMVIYSMNDLSLSVLQEVGKAFGEDRTGVLRLALEAAKVLPPEALAKPEEEKFHSTVRLRADEYEKLEALKQRLNYNANGIFRTGIFLAKRELREYRMNRKSKSNPISIHSDLWDNQVFSPVYNVRQTVIMQP